MKIDFGDVFSSGFGFLVRQSVLFCLAVWAGSAIAGTSLVAGDALRAGRLDFDAFAAVLVSPVLLFSGWLLPNVLFLGINGSRLLIYPESTGLRTWAALIGVEALFAMAVVTRLLEGHWPSIAVAWVSCGILLAMAWTGLWFLHQWRMNRWAGELAMLQAENEMRRAEMKEEYGTESAGHREGMPD